MPGKLASLVASELPVSLPALTAEDGAEIDRALAVYSAAPKGSTRRQINKMMTKLALAYPNLKLSEDEAEARIELYEEMLGDIDLDVLGSGFRAAVRSCKFFPSVSELRELALKQPAPERIVRAHRLRMLAEHHRKAIAEPPKQIATQQEVDAIKAELGLSESASALINRIVGERAA